MDSSLNSAVQNNPETKEGQTKVVLVFWNFVPDEVKLYIVPSAKMGKVTRRLLQENAGRSINSDTETRGLCRLHDSFLSKKEVEQGHFSSAKRHKTDGKFGKYRTKNPNMFVTRPNVEVEAVYTLYFLL